MIAEQGKLLAPNGNPSKLNRYQWAQVRTDNFKSWFGDWKMTLKMRLKLLMKMANRWWFIMVVEHKILLSFTWTSGIFGAGTYFTIRKHEAHAYSNDGVVYEAFINARKPLRVSENI